MAGFSTEKVIKFGAREVLERAEALLLRGMLNGSVCGDFCPWCAVAAAKGELDKEYGTEEILSNIITNRDKELPSDIPLVRAREALLPFTAYYTPPDIGQDVAVSIVRLAAVGAVKLHPKRGD